MNQDSSDDSPSLSRGQLGLLDGNAAVVVGGSRGVGRAVAELLAALGAGVVINGREPDAIEEAVEAVSTAAGADGRRALGFPGSPADETTAQALLATCVEEFGASTSW